MRQRLLLLLLFAVVIAGGTVGILYQEGIGGVKTSEVENEAIAESAEEETEDIIEDSISASESEKADEESQKDSASESEESGDTEEKNSSSSDEDEALQDKSASDSSSDESNASFDKSTSDSSKDEEMTEEEIISLASASSLSSENSSSASAAIDDKVITDSPSSTSDANRKYYTVTVNSGVSKLTVHGTATGESDSMGTVSAGTKGYLIDDSPANRRLVFIENKIGYVSKKYTKLTEIDASHYPEKLLTVTAEDAGKEVEKKEQ